MAPFADPGYVTHDIPYSVEVGVDGDLTPTAHLDGATLSISLRPARVCSAPIRPREPVDEDESRNGRHEANNALSILATCAVDEPVTFEPELGRGLPREVVVLLQLSPLRVGDHRRDDRHHLVFLALEVRQQHI